MEGVLEDFQMNKEQILCFVTDNMLSIIEKINKDEENDIEEDSSEFIEVT